MTYTDLILKHTSESESPRKYWYWAALAAVSAVAKNQVYIDMHLHKLFPNIYVMLVGRSGLRKGPPVALATKLVDAIDNTKVVNGRSSIQAIISDLKLATTKENGGPPLVDATGFLVSDEFAAFLVADPQALTILTQLYDTHYRKEWKNMTKLSGTEVLQNPCITLLAASNEVHLRTALPQDAIAGGFLARTFIIHATKKAGINPLTEKPEHLLPFAELVAPLKKISEAKGEFHWTDKAKKRYALWYEVLQGMDLEDDTGTLERVHDHVVKTSMLVSLSRKPDLKIEYEDIDEAILACQDFIPGARRVAMGQLGASVSAHGTSVLLRALMDKEDHMISRANALEKYWKDFDAPELDRIAESLAASKAIEIKVTMDKTTKKPEMHFIMSGEAIERAKKRFAI
jgi:hypothetical protein